MNRRPHLQIWGVNDRWFETRDGHVPGGSNGDILFPGGGSDTTIGSSWFIGGRQQAPPRHLTVQQQQSAINAGFESSVGAAANVVAAQYGRPVIPYPSLLGGGWVDAHRNASSVTPYWVTRPTFVSNIVPITLQTHNTAIAATAVATPATLDL